jgi:DNA repair exonuclease SbcCD ATPase subunit
MSVQDKRAIVDKIFGFHILNTMRDALKEESKRIKDEMENLSGQMTAISSSIQKGNDEMENLALQIEEESRGKIELLNDSLSSFQKLQEIHNQKISEFKKTEEEFKNSISSLSQSLFESKSKLKEINRKLNLYDSDKCPTCESDLNTEFHSGIKNDLLNESKKFQIDVESMERTHLEMKSKESQLNLEKNEIREKGQKISAKITEISNELAKLNDPGKMDKQMESLKRIIANLEEDSERLNSDNFKIAEKSNWLKILDDILGEKGVKQMAIRTILPSLNSEILELMSQMHLDYQVVFDEEFKATIYHMGIEIPVQTLSTGEMKKVDFVVHVSIMKLMKMKFSTINLLFLDELFSSVDPDGIHAILKILKKVTRELGLNIFVINHAPMPHEIFDWKIEVSKTNNFSNIQLDKF